MTSLLSATRVCSSSGTVSGTGSISVFKGGASRAKVKEIAEAPKAAAKEAADAAIKPLAKSRTLSDRLFC